MILYAGLRNKVSIAKPHPDLASVKRWVLEDAVRGDDLRIEGYADPPAPGADSYCRDAAVAVETAKQYMAKRQGSAMAARA